MLVLLTEEVVGSCLGCLGEVFEVGYLAGKILMQEGHELQGIAQLLS